MNPIKQIETTYIEGYPYQPPIFENNTITYQKYGVTFNLSNNDFIIIDETKHPLGLYSYDMDVFISEIKASGDQNLIEALYCFSKNYPQLLGQFTLEDLRKILEIELHSDNSREIILNILYGITRAYIKFSFEQIENKYIDIYKKQKKDWEALHAFGKESFGIQSMIENLGSGSIIDNKMLEDKILRAVRKLRKVNFGLPIETKIHKLIDKAMSILES